MNPELVDAFSCVLEEAHKAGAKLHDRLGRAMIVSTLLQLVVAEYEDSEDGWDGAEMHKTGLIPEEFKRQYPGAHFCPDWGGKVIFDGMPERETCMCHKPRLVK